MSGEMRVMTVWEKLREPFPPEDIEWRAQSSGIGKNGQPWIKVLAYVDNRAIQERLDEVFGPENWQNEIRIGQAGTLCRLGVRVGREAGTFEWVWKEDGAPPTDFEAFKGGISGAMKRVASTGFGIGRYLYRLPEGWAKIVSENEEARYRDRVLVSETSRLAEEYRNKVWKKDGKQYVTAYWNAPPIPAWALPSKTPGLVVLTSSGNWKYPPLEPPKIEEPSVSEPDGDSSVGDPEAIAKLLSDIHAELKWKEANGEVTHSKAASVFTEAMKMAIDESALSALLAKLRGSNDSQG